jgi:hypothetical protein
MNSNSFKITSNLVSQSCNILNESKQMLLYNGATVWVHMGNSGVNGLAIRYSEAWSAQSHLSSDAQMIKVKFS